MIDWSEIERAISSATGRPVSGSVAESIGGGCINSAYRLEDGAQRYFVKTNSANRVEMFAAEAQGLKEIVGSGTIGAPAPVCWGRAGRSAYLVLEYRDLGGHGDHAALGRRLAAMHHHTGKQFGWHIDNTIGSTPQINTRSEDWVSFFGEYRLAYQFKLAARNGCPGRLMAMGDRLLQGLPSLLAGHTPAPSLLHGDLWSGNYAFDTSGAPVIFDPAVYYGDRETDLAMTELFGGFSPSFYAAYREAWPLDPGYGMRRTLYNLYHILNHFNLFGGGYGAQAEQMTARLLSEIRG